MKHNWFIFNGNKWVVQRYELESDDRQGRIDMPSEYMSLRWPDQIAHFFCGAMWRVEAHAEDVKLIILHQLSNEEFQRKKGGFLAALFILESNRQVEATE